MSTTYTQTLTFTETHAKQIASKVAADLLRFQRLYNSPTDEWITKYEGELTQLLKNDVLKEVVYGFQRNGQWTEATVKYKALPGGNLNVNDDPGKIRPNLDVANAHFTSFLSYNDKWSQLTQPQKDAVRAACPFQRGDGSTPMLEGGGYWADDHSYISGGRGIGRSSAKR